MTDLIKLNVDTTPLVKLASGLRVAGKAAPAAMAAGLNATGMKTRTQMRRALVGQSGLKYNVMVRAIRSKPATPGNLRFEIKSAGGNIRLKYFKPRETKAGVTAVPWNKRILYGGAFIKGGRFPNRVGLRIGKGNVYERVGAGRFPLRVKRSDLYIPDEMVTGASRAAFEQTTARDLQDQTVRALYAILSGVSAAGR